MRAAHSAVVTLTAVQADRICSQLNRPGVTIRGPNEVRTVAYIAAAHAAPNRRCIRSPRRRRSSTSAPSAIAVVAESACPATSGVQTCRVTAGTEASTVLCMTRL